MQEKPIFADKGVIAEVVSECQSRAAGGASQEAVIRYLHDKGFSILDCMKIVKKVYGIGLNEAKTRVTAHPSWRLETERMNEFNRGLTEALEEALERNEL
jgi:ribosomal protein L7/L12